MPYPTVPDLHPGRPTACEHVPWILARGHSRRALAAGARARARARDAGVVAQDDGLASFGGAERLFSNLGLGLHGVRADPFRPGRTGAAAVGTIRTGSAVFARTGTENAWCQAQFGEGRALAAAGDEAAAREYFATALAGVEPLGTLGAPERVRAALRALDLS